MMAGSPWIIRGWMAICVALGFLSVPIRAEDPLVFGVAPIESPSASEEFCRQFTAYLSRALNQEVQDFHSETYEEMNSALETGRVHLASICTGAYVALDPKSVRMVLVPVIRGKERYFGLIVSHEALVFNDFGGLRGKLFAYTDPLSNTGCLYPRYRLQELGWDPDRFFSKVYFTKGHDRALFLVSKGVVDGAAVNSLAFERAQREDPDMMRGVHVLHQSTIPFPNPPFVISSHTSEQLARQLERLLLSMKEDEAGQSLLESFGLEGFVKGNDHLFDEIREMRTNVKMLSWPEGGGTL